MTYKYSAPTLPPATQFGRLVIQVHRLWRRELDHALVGHGLSLATALPLLMLRERGELRQNALAEALGIECPSLVRLLDALAAEGLVERREDPADRRAKVLHLTPLGQRRAQAAEDALAVMRARLLADVSEEDLARTLHVLRTVEGRLDREAETRRPGAEGDAA